MSSWQDAVANLQSQINTLNSQIATLSGQEAANTTQIVSLQSAVSALQAEILVLQSLIVADFSGQIANSSATVDTAVVSLTAGGFASIPVASLAGLSKLTIFGHAAPTSGALQFGIHLGDPANLGNSFGVSNSAISAGAFAFDITTLFDEVTNTIRFVANSGGSILNPSLPINSDLGPFSLSSLTNPQLFFIAWFNSGPGTVSIDQLRVRQ